jgi:hypothetical protein
MRGRLVGLEQQVSLIDYPLGITPDQVADQLDELRWRGVFVSDFGAPSTTHADRVSVNAQSYVTEYRDEQGASGGFTLIENEIEGARDTDAPTIGDESELTRSEGVDPLGVEYERLDYTFRSGPFVGGIAIHWFEGAGANSVSPEEMAASAQVLLDRIESVAAESDLGLFGKTLRLNPGEAFTTIEQEEEYQLLDGNTPRFYGEDVQEASSTTMLWNASGVTGSYSNYIYVEPTDGSSTGGTVIILRVYELESLDEAEAFVDAAAQYLAERSAEVGYSSMEPVEMLPERDGVHAGVAYTWPLGDGAESQGYRLWLQEGTYVVNIESDHPEGIDLTVLTGVLEEQAECVTSDRFCRPMDVPEDLVG